MLAIQSGIAKYHWLYSQGAVAFQMPGVFSDSTGSLQPYFDRSTHPPGAGPLPPLPLLCGGGGLLCRILRKIIMQIRINQNTGIYSKERLMLQQFIIHMIMIDDAAQYNAKHPAACEWCLLASDI